MAPGNICCVFVCLIHYCWCDLVMYNRYIPTYIPTYLHTHCTNFFSYFPIFSLLIVSFTVYMFCFFSSSSSSLLMSLKFYYSLLNSSYRHRVNLDLLFSNPLSWCSIKRYTALLIVINFNKYKAIILLFIYQDI